mmetsp:Transcript_48218/g.86948  ORF Transcript_48218/g.86948 Transcript_48218/m.86948 type:complete len:393 (+) Transcript_48218:53-1231(+)|eukprot:CAMPEP_0197639924 /NCGR_PEP_ID=MMETSP1338-20131121/14394_1 /TAXON_ID=43686 ORGANISM="Pelagodinium beii, Strain RCC1491" /NCGR_SAMPLE_ID=MMETSP1338 /ASSEMBLY_ACC=CAM_ASM_000754 /LENGTH=392 /DNA_ID=CAMNT_0043212715 /DNA_START=49 /DNA_END=1227 /DNA_ORIENTATION=-
MIHGSSREVRTSAFPVDARRSRSKFLQFVVTAGLGWVLVGSSQLELCLSALHNIPIMTTAASQQSRYVLSPVNGSHRSGLLIGSTIGIIACCIGVYRSWRHTTFPINTCDRSRQLQRLVRHQKNVETPWAILGLAAPVPGQLQIPPEKMIKHAFRQVVKEAHPDTETGSVERFRQVVWAYHEIVTKGMSAGQLGLPVEDSIDPLQDLWDEYMAKVDRSKFAALDAQMDDDGWCGRSPVTDLFVSRHDAVNGMVHEGDVAIFRMQQEIGGRVWGLGKIVAIQKATIPGVGKDGVIYMHPLKQTQVQAHGHLHLIPDECDDIAETRVIDRFEVLRFGVEALDGEYVIEKDSRSYRRIMSGNVHFGQCEFEEECEMKASQCLYCYDNEECEAVYE